MEEKNNLFLEKTFNTLKTLKAKRNKVIYIFIIVSFFFGFVFLNTFSNINERIKELKNDTFVLNNKMKKIFNLILNKDKIKKENIKLKKYVVKKDSPFSYKTSTKDLLLSISNIAKQTNINVKIFKPLKGKDDKNFTKTSFLLLGTGKFYKILKFIELLEDNKCFLNLKEISINKAQLSEMKKKKSILELKLEFDVLKLKN